MTGDDPALDAVEPAAYRLLTDLPQADGTLACDATTAIVVPVRGGGTSGLGSTYGRSGRGWTYAGPCPPSTSRCGIQGTLRDLPLATPNLRHLEWFHDHERFEHRLIHSALAPHAGRIRPGPTAAGHGLVVRHDADGRRVA